MCVLPCTPKEMELIWLCFRSYRLRWGHTSTSTTGILVSSFTTMLARCVTTFDLRAYKPQTFEQWCICCSTPKLLLITYLFDPGVVWYQRFLWAKQRRAFSWPHRTDAKQPIVSANSLFLSRHKNCLYSEVVLGLVKSRERNITEIQETKTDECNQFPWNTGFLLLESSSKLA